MPQRPSPRAGPPTLRTSSSDSDPSHHRSRTDRSPKLSGGRSPRGSSHSEPAVNQKKLGSRIADLESQLGQAQDELKCLKTQLSTAEAAKKAAQEQLDKKSKKQPKKDPEPVENQELNDETSSVVVQLETDVFEVPVENTKLNERDRELETLRQENENIKSQLHEKLLKISSAESEIEELNLRLGKIDQELGESKISAAHTSEKLEASEKAKEELENEMKRLRVQTEQWRKAADAAANILAGETEMNGRRISERCGSMDKHYGNGFEPGPDDVFGSGKRKGSGIRMFGDLWKKKGNK
ncbi:interactor of constitutive active rops 1 [Phtheirospermum japonicum]|uniref:Interactor of constitutive active rops 1 n=1 Tax=Phtheirospermum japonicum TaxID=374723 RepID=A0A830D8F9_9LAMI|nr:interactor of constitutive active rops 1 [Phtheirospermum japonicum]